MLFNCLLPLLPVVAAAGSVHKLKLKKEPISLDRFSPLAAAQELAGKYGDSKQTPLMGSGGYGRNIRTETPNDGLYHTQDGKGTHNVPLSSESNDTGLMLELYLMTNYRLHECPILCRNLPWNSSPALQSYP